MERNELVALMRLMRIEPENNEEIETLLQEMRAISAMAEELPQAEEAISQDNLCGMQLREDIHVACEIPQEVLLSNAPAVVDDCFAVPKTISQGGEC